MSKRSASESERASRVLEEIHDELERFLCFQDSNGDMATLIALEQRLLLPSSDDGEIRSLRQNVNDLTKKLTQNQQTQENLKEYMAMKSEIETLKCTISVLEKKQREFGKPTSSVGTCQECFSLKGEINSLRSLLEQAKRQCQLSEDKIRSLGNTATHESELKCEIITLREALLELKSSNLLSLSAAEPPSEGITSRKRAKVEYDNIPSNDDKNLMMRQMESELNRVNVLLSKSETECRALKGKMQNLELYRIHEQSLQTKLDRANNELLELRQQSVDLEEAKHEKERWAAYAAQLGNAEEISQTMRRLQQENLLLENTVSDLKTEIRILSSQRLQDSCSLDQDRSRASSLQSVLLATKTELAHRQREVERLNAEKQSLLSWVENSKENKGNLDALTNYTTQTINFEKTIREKEAEIVREFTRADSAEAARVVLLERVAQLEVSCRREEEECSTMKSQLKIIEKERDKLYQEVQSLQVRVSRGDFNPDKTKVLRLTAPNPSQESRKQEQIDTLRAEIEVLKSELEQASNKATSGLETPHLDVTGSTAKVSQQLTEQKKEITDLKTKELRLKEVFGEKINEFREAMFALLGYQIDWQGRSYTLRSVYADRKEDVFLCKDGKAGFQILETDFIKTIAASSDDGAASAIMYLTQFNSIPAFLAQVTLDLFNKQTMMPGAKR